MTKRTKIGKATTRAATQDALRRAADSAEADRGHRAAKQRRHLEELSRRVDVAVLLSEEMWR